jgi:hypothetical protein
MHARLRCTSAVLHVHVVTKNTDASIAAMAFGLWYGGLEYDDRGLPASYSAVSLSWILAGSHLPAPDGSEDRMLVEIQDLPEYM